MQIQGAVWRYGQYLGAERNKIFKGGIFTWPLNEDEMSELRPPPPPPPHLPLSQLSEKKQEKKQYQ